jgi:hypothetical protein
VCEDETTLSVWLTMADGGTLALHIDLAEVMRRAHRVEEAQHPPASVCVH